MRAQFARALAAVFAVAFASLYAQLPETLGPTSGVDPAHALLEQRRVPGAPLDAFVAHPSAAWVLDAAGLPPATALDAIGVGGTALSVAVAAGWLAPNPVTLFFLPFLYLSLVNAGRPWLEAAVAGGADGLLIEAGWGAALWSVGGSVTPTAPLLLLRWAAAKAAWRDGLAAAPTLRAAWFEDGSIPAAAAAVGGLVLAPLALAPSGAARAVAAAACVVAPAVAGVRAWPLLLRAVLALPVLASGGGGGRGQPAGLAVVSAAASLAPAAQLSVALLRYTVDPATGARVPAASDAAVAAAAARGAPVVVALAGAAVAVALGLDLWASLVAAHGDPFRDGAPARGPAAASRGRPASASARPASPSSGATPAALAGAAAALIFAAGAVDVVAAARGGGRVPGCAACGAPRAFVAAARLTHAARPWRAAGGVGAEAGGGGGGVTVQVRTTCDADADDGDDDAGWTPLAPPPASSILHTPRLGPALASASVATSPWAFHAAALLVGGRAPALAAALGAAADAPPPCAARVVDVAPPHAASPVVAAADVNTGDDDAAPTARALARHGWGPLVRYEGGERCRALAALLAAPRSLGAGGASAVGAGVVGVAAVAARRRGGGGAGVRARGRAVAKRD